MRLPQKAIRRQLSLRLERHPALAAAALEATSIRWLRDQRLWNLLLAILAREGGTCLDRNFYQPAVLPTFSGV